MADTPKTFCLSGPKLRSFWCLMTTTCDAFSSYAQSFDEYRCSGRSLPIIIPFTAASDEALESGETLVMA